MNYERIYNDLIAAAKDRQLNVDGYYEKHHIVPRSMGGGDEVSNIVKLTAREHFIAHALLATFVKTEPARSRLASAFFAMCKQKRSYQDRYICSSKMYEIARKGHAGSMSKLHSGKRLSTSHIEALRKGHKDFFANEELMKVHSARLKEMYTPERRAKISATMKELAQDPVYIESVKRGLIEHYQTEAGDAHKAIMSEQSKQRWQDPAYREKMTQASRERWDMMTDDEYQTVCEKRRNNVTDEFRERMAVINKANAAETHKKVECEVCRKMISRQNYAISHGVKCGIKLQQKKVNCVHCGKTCSPSTLVRWHNDNCKYKNGVKLDV